MSRGAYVWATGIEHAAGQSVLQVEELAIGEDDRLVPERRGTFIVAHKNGTHRLEIEATWPVKGRTGDRIRFVDVDDPAFTWEAERQP